MCRSYFSPKIDLDTLKGVIHQPHTLLLCVCACVCVNKSYHVSVFMRVHLYVCVPTYGVERNQKGVFGRGMYVGVHSPQAINKLCAYKETCREVVK